MTSLRRPRIALQLRRLVVGACLGVISVTGVCLMLSQWLLIRRQMALTQQVKARILAANVVAPLAFRSPDDGVVILRGLQSDPTALGAAVYDRTGAMFCAFKAEPNAAAVPLRPAHTYRYTWHDFTVAVPVTMPDGRIAGTLVLQSSLHDQYVNLGVFVAVTLGIMAVATLLTVVLSQRFVGLISEPITALAAIAERIRRTNNFSLRAQPRSNDEIGELANAFNAMVQRIESSQAETRRLNEQLQAHAIELERRVEERTAALQRSYRELEAFSYSVSHDLRGPVRAISGFAEILLDEAKELSPENLQHVRRIIGAVTRMNRLIDALLDFSRVASRELQTVPLDLAAMANEVVAELRPAAPGHAIHLSVGDLDPCLGDPILIRQVLVNLIGNALKYSRYRDPAIITISQETAGPENRTAYVVRDNGAGFDVARAQRLFEVFERFHDPKEFEGTGVGLATTKRIIERHGGRIWAESAPGQGAAFFFTLPPMPTGSTPAPFPPAATTEPRGD